MVVVFPLYNDPAFVLRGDQVLKQPPKPEPSARNACYRVDLERVRALHFATIIRSFFTTKLSLRNETQPFG